jgi:hypothetical protein
MRRDATGVYHFEPVHFQQVPLHSPFLGHV